MADEAAQTLGHFSRQRNSRWRSCTLFWNLCCFCVCSFGLHEVTFFYSDFHLPISLDFISGSAGLATHLYITIRTRFTLKYKIISSPVCRNPSGAAVRRFGLRLSGCYRFISELPRAVGMKALGRQSIPHSRVSRWCVFYHCASMLISYFSKKSSQFRLWEFIYDSVAL